MIINSCLSVFLVVAPNKAPNRGISERSGTPVREELFVSLISPAIATVSPSLTDNVVSTLVTEKLGPKVLLAPGLLTS